MTALLLDPAPHDHCHAAPTLFTDDGEPQVQRPMVGFEECCFLAAEPQVPGNP
ncbi:MAG: hypothetical protein IPG54_11160 [Sphingomonadales bacterium]|nr:hypothetical protein [Sphingomonadales bacterium]MBK9004263.1 hypothetical protein [Sphingomonadales bacterium]MBK9269439.1 hypothetical protein [Sphingomonadales bacterium]MBP6435271.1 hypothetical protein [Sphingorhabdus sp.]